MESYQEDKGGWDLGGKPNLFGLEAETAHDRPLHFLVIPTASAYIAPTQSCRRLGSQNHTEQLAKHTRLVVTCSREQRRPHLQCRQKRAPPTCASNHRYIETSSPLILGGCGVEERPDKVSRRQGRRHREHRGERIAGERRRLEP